MRWISEPTIQQSQNKVRLRRSIVFPIIFRIVYIFLDNCPLLC